MAGLRGSRRAGLLRLYEDVENPDPELAGIPAATRFERPIEADPDLRHLTVAKLGGGQGECLQRPVLRVGRERGNRLPPRGHGHLLRRGEQIGTRIKLEIEGRILLWIAESDRGVLLRPLPLGSRIVWVDLRWMPAVPVDQEDILGLRQQRELSNLVLMPGCLARPEGQPLARRDVVKTEPDDRLADVREVRNEDRPGVLNRLTRLPGQTSASAAGGRPARASPLPDP